jgi:DsbC/DsbD-like thiol-disulfide interchange protein
MRQKLILSAVLFFCMPPLLALQSSWQPKDKGLDLTGAPQQGKEWVHLVSATEVVVPAGQAHPLTLKFLINSGLHINSHTPRSAYLVPTTLTLDAPAGMHITAMEFPQGVDYHFHFAPRETLSVYTGEFTVNARAQAAPGTYTVRGKLHYQSCDNQECNPPKTLPFTLQVTAR